MRFFLSPSPLYSQTSWGILSLLLIGCAGATPVKVGANTTLPPPSLPQFDYLVGPGDVLRVNVAGEPELSSAPYKANVPGSPVGASGAIQLPFIGVVPVSGKTVFQIKEDVEARLLQYLKVPSVDVAVVEFGAKRFYVLGEVQKPGMFILDRPITALQAVSLTGGFTPDANRKQIALIRGAVKAENIALFSAERLTAEGNFAIAPGDMVFVGRHSWAGASQVARDLVSVLQLISLPVGTARDIAFFQDIRGQ